MDYIIRQHESQKKKKMYFTKETEEAIVKYNNSSSQSEKNYLYNTYIHYAFYKLTQNIIHTFKFYHTDIENLEDLQHEIIVFLLDKIHMFNPENGAKAYSYFGTIVKNYLIIYNQKNYKDKINNININDLDDLSKIDFLDPNFITPKNLSHDIENISEENHTSESYLGEEYNSLDIFLNHYVDYCTKNIKEIFQKEEDLKIADAILEIFRNRSGLEILNKKTLYIYIREIIDIKTPKITKVAKDLYEIYKQQYIFYLENGYFNN